MRVRKLALFKDAEIDFPKSAVCYDILEPWNANLGLYLHSISLRSEPRYFVNIDMAEFAYSLAFVHFRGRGEIYRGDNCYGADVIKEYRIYAKSLRYNPHDSILRSRADLTNQRRQDCEVETRTSSIRTSLRFWDAESNITAEHDDVIIYSPRWKSRIGVPEERCIPTLSEKGSIVLLSATVASFLI